MNDDIFDSIRNEMEMSRREILQLLGGAGGAATGMGVGTATATGSSGAGFSGDPVSLEAAPLELSMVPNPSHISMSRLFDEAIDEMASRAKSEIKSWINGFTNSLGDAVSLLDDIVDDFPKPLDTLEFLVNKGQELLNELQAAAQTTTTQSSSNVVVNRVNQVSSAGPSATTGLGIPDLGDIANAAGNLTESTINGIADNISNLSQYLPDEFSDLNALVDYISNLGGLLSLFDEIADEIADMLGDAWDGVKSTFDNMISNNSVSLNLNPDFSNLDIELPVDVGSSSGDTFDLSNISLPSTTSPTSTTSSSPPPYQSCGSGHKVYPFSQARNAARNDANNATVDVGTLTLKPSWCRTAGPVATVGFNYEVQFGNGTKWGSSVWYGVGPLGRCVYYGLKPAPWSGGTLEPATIGDLMPHVKEVQIGEGAASRYVKNVVDDHLVDIQNYTGSGSSSNSVDDLETDLDQFSTDLGLLPCILRNNLNSQWEADRFLSEAAHGELETKVSNAQTAVGDMKDALSQSDVPSKLLEIQSALTSLGISIPAPLQGIGPVANPLTSSSINWSNVPVDATQRLENAARNTVSWIQSQSSTRRNNIDSAVGFTLQDFIDNVTDLSNPVFGSYQNVLTELNEISQKGSTVINNVSQREPPEFDFPVMYNTDLVCDKNCRNGRPNNPLPTPHMIARELIDDVGNWVNDFIEDARDAVQIELPGPLHDTWVQKWVVIILTAIVVAAVIAFFVSPADEIAIGGVVIVSGLAILAGVVIAFIKSLVNSFGDAIAPERGGPSQL